MGEWRETELSTFSFYCDYIDLCCSRNSIVWNSANFMYPSLWTDHSIWTVKGSWPLPLNHNMRFYAVSKALWIVVDYAWTQDQNLPFIGYPRSEDILLAYQIMSCFLSQAGNYRYLWNVLKKNITSKLGNSVHWIVEISKMKVS